MLCVLTQPLITTNVNLQLHTVDKVFSHTFYISWVTSSESLTLGVPCQNLEMTILNVSEVLSTSNSCNHLGGHVS